jgi:hypothetical protein
MCDNYKYADKKDLEMMRACNKCPIPYSECPATADCPHLIDLMNHPVTGCDPVGYYVSSVYHGFSEDGPSYEEMNNDPDGDPVGNGDPVDPIRDNVIAWED